MTFEEIIKLIGRFIEGLGVWVIVIGIAMVSVAYVRWRRRCGARVLAVSSRARTCDSARARAAVAGGIIRTVAIDPNFQSVGVLAVIVTVRTFLSWSLEVELETGRGAGLLFILPLIWTGTLVFGAMTKALNVAFETNTRYSFLKRLQLRLVMLLSLGVIFLLALSSSPLLRLLHFVLGVLPLGGDFVAQVILHVVPALLVLLGFFLAYRFVPTRRPGWHAALIGAIVAALIFLAAKPLFLGYVQALARHNVVYGSLAGIIAAVIWAWVVAMIGIFGGQLTVALPVRAVRRGVDRRSEAPPSRARPPIQTLASRRQKFFVGRCGNFRPLQLTAAGNKRP